MGRKNISSTVSRWNWNLVVLFWGGGGTENPENSETSLDKNQQQTHIATSKDTNFFLSSKICDLSFNDWSPERST